MNGELDKLSDWLLANKLSLNETKTELLIVRPKNTDYPEHLNIKINNHKLIPVTHVKYLGCIIDEHLTWNQHVKQLIKKLSSAVGILSKLRHYANKKNLLKRLLCDFSFAYNLWLTCLAIHFK